RQRAGLRWFACDSQDVPGAWATALEAIRFVRTQRRPAFVHLRTVRLMGHAGSDVEANYLPLDAIESNEARDPLLAFADLLLRGGALSPDEILALYADTDARLRRAADEACRRPKLTTPAHVAEPLLLPRDDELELRVADRARRLEVFGGRLPED